MWVVWSVALAAYIVGVMHRTSFGVAGLDAAQRFHAGPAALSGFVVLQLLVYAALQVPVGLLLDRFGGRALVAVGALTMAAGQLVLALATTLPLAVTARVLVGAGDALTFISVLSVVTAWFPPRRVPVMTQLTGLVGQLGQVLSAVPLAALLHGPGWTTAFLCAAGLGVFVGLAVLVVVRDRPPGAPPPPPAASPREVLRGLRTSWFEPGTRLGLWTHMGTQFCGTVFGLLWGVPYLVAGQGMSAGQASALLTLLVVVGILAGPLFGEFAAAAPDAPVVAGARRDRRPRAGVGRGAARPAAGAAVAARRARDRDRHRRARLDDRLRLRAHVQPALAAGRRRSGSSTWVASSRPCWWRGRSGSCSAGPAATRRRRSGLRGRCSTPVWAFAVVAVLGSRRLARRKLAAEGVVILPAVGGAGAVAEPPEVLTPTPS